jgi:hypothetical protein
MTSSDKIAHNSWLPQITFSDKVSTPLELSSHKLSVQVAAPLALVTSVLTFVNKHNRTLQGELVFPLPDDATVTGYALDVNGTMVDAVPIEKEKAKVVFEEAVRSGKGASVVEMAAQSNSFKTSIYPLHANQSRTIKVVYNMPVGTVDNQSQITLPFGTPAESVHVSANIEWKNSDKVHVQLVKGDKREDSTTQIDLKDTNVEALVISSENTLKDNQVTVEGNYFCARIKVEQPKEKEVTQPNNVQILYDVSYSRREQHVKDTKLLTTVLNKLNPKQITLTAFSVDPRPAISCASVPDFLKQFEQVVFDGATNLENVEQSLDENADFCILLTDGLHTIGDDVNPESVYSIPMYIVTTTKSSNQHLLSHMATKSGGAYLNANSMSNEQIAAKIGTPVLFFLVADYEPDQFEEVYPNEPVTLETGGFLHLYGKIKNSGGEIVVSFKYGRDVCETREIQIGAAQAIENPKEKIIPKLWAKQKLASLSAFPKLFANEMKELALDWKIVTANTSLIVLEEVSQYLKHDITPPETLDYVYKAYMVLKKDKQRSAEQEKQDKIRSVLSKWNERKQWHKTDFKSAIDQKRKEEEERKKQEEERRKQEEERRVQQSTIQRSLDSVRGTIPKVLDNLLERGESLDGLQMRSEELSMSASSFMRREAPMSRSRASPAPQSLLRASSASRKRSEAPQEEISILADEPSNDFSNCEEQGEFDEDEDEEGGCSSDDEGVEKKESTSSSSTSASIQVQKWSSDQPYMTQSNQPLTSIKSIWK